jgi:septal ring-binding cell division protein DamX
VATLEDVRKALTDLKTARDQATAVGILQTVGGAANLTGLAPEKYGTVVAAAKAAMPAPAAPVEPEDPFAVPAAPAPAAPAKPLTLEDVKAAVVAAQKRTGTDTVQKVVMEHGGKAPGADGGPAMPSLKALPPDQFAACIAAINALPTTK